MNRLVESRTSGAARRPWPFGPPLLGRASRSAAGAQFAARPDRQSRLAPAPIGGLPCAYHPCSVF